jgi:hypothetical protein
LLELGEKPGALVGKRGRKQEGIDAEFHGGRLRRREKAVKSKFGWSPAGIQASA